MHFYLGWLSFSALSMVPLLKPVPGACVAALVGAFMDGFLDAHDAQNCRQHPGHAGNLLLAVVFARGLRKFTNRQGYPMQLPLGS